MVAVTLLVGAAAASWERKLTDSDMQNVAQNEETFNYKELEPAGNQLDSSGNEKQVVVPGQKIDPSVVAPATGWQNWEREENFITKSNMLREHNLPYLRVVGQPAETAATKVLAVSDSFIWGYGAADLDMLWSQELERSLRAAHPGEAIDVIRLGRGGASLIEYSEWLTDDYLNRVKPAAIVIGFVSNDQIPSGYERSICREEYPCNVGSASSTPPYLRCLQGKEGMIGRLLHTGFSHLFPRVTEKLMIRYCAPKLKITGLNISIEELNLHPERNPYVSFFDDAAERLLEINKRIPVIIAPTKHNKTVLTKPNPYIARLKAKGLTVIPMEYSEQLLTENLNNLTSLYMLPTDDHPNAILTKAYAKDIMKVLGPMDIVKPETAGEPTIRPLINNFLPASTAVKVVNNKTVEIGTSDDDTDAMGSFGSSVGIDGRVTPNQFAPCAPLNRPHARFMFNRDLVTGSVVEVEALSAQSDLIVVPVGYRPDGRSFQGEPVALPRGGSISVNFADGITGLLVAGSTKGCDLDKVLNVDRFQLRFTLR